MLDGDKIIKETIHEPSGYGVLVPIYDSEDEVCGIEYNGTAYYFLKNLQEDVIAITDDSGNVVAKYSYDAWGVCTITMDSSGCSIAEINPYRYRSYYYDSESGLYYLQSRYYDPTTGRFINGDDPAIVGLLTEPLQHNLFAYCENDPTTNVDLWGYIKINIKWLGTAIDLILWLIPTLFVISKIWKSVSKSASKLVSFGKKLISVGKQLFKRFDNRIYRAFAKESTYRVIKTIGVLAGVINIFFSIGNVVQYIVDILDGKWDGYLDTNRFAPKLTLKRTY